MPYKTLSHFIQELERKGELIRIKEFVDPELEITEVTDRFSKQPDGGKALLFENTGTAFPVLTNAFGSSRRAAMSLGVEDPDELARDIDVLFKAISSPKNNLLEKIKTLPQFVKIARWFPKTVKGRGECQQVILKNPDLNVLPVLKCWPHDGGRFITLPMVFTKDPITGIRNVGMYRMQIFDKNLTGMHWHRHKTGARHFDEYKKRGELMPVAVAIGGDPAYTYSATAPLPDNIDEMLLAGFLRKKRVELVKCVTIELEVPRDADFIIEGYVDPSEEPIWEGPFGDHTGFYSLADWYPKFHVTCITHRKNAIYPATIVGVPPMEDAFLAKLTERIFLSPIKLSLIPELLDMNLPIEGVAHNIAIAKIAKTFPGQPNKVASAMWGAGQMMFNKFMVVVDGDVDLNDYKGIAKSVSANFNPLSDVFFGYGPLDVLDHASEKPCVGGKLLIDATGKENEEERVSSQGNNFDASAISEALGVGVKGVFDYSTILISEGISALVISVEKSLGLTVKGVIYQLIGIIESNLPKIIMVVDKQIKLNNLGLVCWYVSANIDPTRDCFLPEKGGKRFPCLVLDGTGKFYPIDNLSRSWPNIVASDPNTVRIIDDKWNKLGLGGFIPSPSIQFHNLTHSCGAVVKI